MKLLDFQAYHFRNLSDRLIRFSPGFNLITGDNGQGKTNLLEAIAVVGNLRSFRTAQIRRLIRTQHSAFRIAATVERKTRTHSIEVVTDTDISIQRILRIDRQETSVAEYLEFVPIWVLSPADRDLVIGPPQFRRSFLDRQAFLLDPQYLPVYRNYERILKQRNAALTGASSDDELTIWERHLAQAGAQLTDRRLRMTAILKKRFLDEMEHFHRAGFPTLTLAYRGESWIEDVEDAHNRIESLEEQYFQRYNEYRARDRRAGFTFEGPHRHDVALRADTRPVRDVLSSGQVKIVAAALRMASLSTVEDARGEILPVIVDDVDAELDAISLSRLVVRLGLNRQVFLSSVHQFFGENELKEIPNLRSKVFEMRSGSIVHKAGEGHE